MTEVQLTEYAPIIAAGGAIIVALLAWHSSRKPKLDAAQVDKIKAEIAKDENAAKQESARANAKRDRHIVRLEQWGFEMVRPWGRRAAIVVDEQNDLLVELAARANIPFEPKHLAPFPEMPQIDDD